MFLIIAESLGPISEYIRNNLKINFPIFVLDAISVKKPDIEIGIEDNLEDDFKICIPDCYSSQEELDKLV
jgi:hypothetical protein